MGHVYMIILVMLCQTLVYREVTALFSLRHATPETGEVPQSRKDPWSKTLNWYFFAITNYFLYGESIIYYFKVTSVHVLNDNRTYSDAPLACRIRRCSAIAFRDQPPYHQFYSLYDRICRICHVSQEGLLEATIWFVLLGPHELASHCRLKVGKSIRINLTILLIF